MNTDRFGNEIDSGVGYARGRLLASSGDEIRRLRHAQHLTRQIVAARGLDRISIFTGNRRAFPLAPEDLSRYCEEWVGPGLFAGELADVARDHFGATAKEAVAVINRTSAAIIAAVLALSHARDVVSIVPDGDRSHASVARGCKLARVALHDVGAGQDPQALITRHKPALVVLTTVTSTLARIDDAASTAAIEAARRAGAVVLLDEAYGARLRVALHGGAKSLTLGADFAVTNTDKAGLSGPRAGVVVGAHDPVLATLAKASELGQEARAPIAAGAMRSLQHYAPQALLSQAREGTAIADALCARFGAEIVHRSDLGPSIGEEDILFLLMQRCGVKRAPVVPAEACAALGMVLLRDYGVLSVNTHGAPGGRVSLRLKPTGGALESVGGAGALADALACALDEVAAHMDDEAWLRATLFGTHE